jgi:fibronectin-binding autotransporter adhesin
MKKIFKYSILALAFSARIGAADNTWVGLAAPIAPATGNMSNAANWNPAGPPTGNLTFPAGSVPTFVYIATNDLGANYPVSSITISAPTNSYTLNATGASSFLIASGSILDTSAGTTAQHLISMPLSLAGPLTVNASSTAAGLTISGNIAGAGALTLASGQLTLSGTNTFAGGISIATAATPPAILTVTQGVSIPGNVTNNGALVLAPAVATAQSYAGIISGTGTVQMNSAIGTWNFTNASVNTYSGGTTITAGTLGIVSTANLGTGTVTLGAGTLSLNNAGGYNIPITVTGAGKIALTAATATLSGVIGQPASGTGSLSIAAGNAQVLTLTGVNTYSGGTTLTSGTLSIQAQNNIGTGPFTMGGSVNTTLSITQPIIAFSAPITLQGTSTIDTNSQNVAITKPITGAGPLTLSVDGGSTLLLSSAGGPYTYTGLTTVNSATAGIVKGDTKGLQTDFNISSTNSTLVFDQSTNSVGDGTYAGVLTGTGNIIKQAAGIVTFSGNSGAFAGPTRISGGTLNLTGSLIGSPVTVASSGSLTGSGNVDSIVVNSGGTLGPNGLNRLTVNGTTGTVQFDAGSLFMVDIQPQGISDTLSVANTTTIAPNPTYNVYVDPADGFYGFGAAYTILRTQTLAGTFNPTVQSSDPNFIFTLSYETRPLLPPVTDVILNLTTIQPFFDFPSENSNVASVVSNINALSAEGSLTTNSGLVSVINSFIGQNNATINNALDQLHPAIFSAFGELQADLGGQLISMFHRRPGPTCCDNILRVWAEPYGNWLVEKDIGKQQGFNSRSLGVAAGFDMEVLQNLVIGFGGAGNHTDLTWKHDRGHSDINGYYGAVYVDYTYNWLYLGASVLGGIDEYRTNRKMKFTTIDQTAQSNHQALDLIGQFSCGVFFGPSACVMFPFINIDYLYLDQWSFKEKGAPGLNLDVDSFNSQTIRTELGMGLQIKDSNYDESMCISPRLAIGYSTEIPVRREDITSKFAGEDISFDVEGWDYTWQLFTFSFGLNMSYKCVTLGGEYVGEFDGNNRYWGQRANLNLTWNL